MTYSIVLARVETEDVLVDDAGADIGRSRRFAKKPKPEAAVWLNKGTTDDINKAVTYAQRTGDGWEVYVYPNPERDPLGRAKADALKAHANA